MMKIEPMRAFPGLAWVRTLLKRRSAPACAPYIDADDMPDWQSRDLGFRDGRITIRDEIWRR